MERRHVEVETERKGGRRPNGSFVCVFQAASIIIILVELNHL